VSGMSRSNDVSSLNVTLIEYSRSGFLFLGPVKWFSASSNSAFFVRVTEPIAMRTSSVNGTSCDLITINTTNNACSDETYNLLKISYT